MRAILALWLFCSAALAGETAPGCGRSLVGESKLARLQSQEPALGVKKPDDWIRVRLDDLKRVGLKSLATECFGGSPYAIARALYPSHPFPFWKLERLPRKVFEPIEAQARFLAWLGKEKSIEKPSDWYRLSTKDFLAANGLQLLKIYGYSKAALLEAHYPGEKFYDWLFAGKVPNGFWEEPEHRREYMRWLAERLGLREDDDWYRVSYDDFKNNHGLGLLSYFENDKPKAIQDFLSHRALQPWRFTSGTPRGLFDEPTTVAAFGKWLLEKPDFASPDKVLTISAKQLMAFGANSLLSRHGRSPHKTALAILDAVQADVERHPWLSNRLPDGYWEATEHRREFWQWLGKRMGWTKPDDWYALEHAVLEQYASNSLLGRFPSLAAMAREANPTATYHEWLFSKVPGDFWAERENRLRYLAWLAKLLEIQEADDWYRVSHDLVFEHAGAGIADRYGNSVARLVMENLPELGLVADKFVYYSKAEEAMALQLQPLFPGAVMHRRYRSRDYRFSSGRSVEMDVYFPELRLAFEYQGEQHFVAREFFGGAAGLADTQRRDAEKRKVLEAAKIKLVEVLHTWDQTPRSLRKILEANGVALAP